MIAIAVPIAIHIVRFIVKTRAFCIYKFISYYAVSLKYLCDTAIAQQTI